MSLSRVLFVSSELFARNTTAKFSSTFVLKSARLYNNGSFLWLEFFCSKFIRTSPFSSGSTCPQSWVLLIIDLLFKIIKLHPNLQKYFFFIFVLETSEIYCILLSVLWRTFSYIQQKLSKALLYLFFFNNWNQSFQNHIYLNNSIHWMTFLW